MFTAILSIAMSVPAWDGRVENRSGLGYRYLYGNGYYPPGAIPPWYRVYPLPNARADAAASLRYHAKYHPRPSRKTMEEVQFWDSQRAERYAKLRAADPADKSKLRAEWIDAHKELERSRLKAAKEARRR